MSERSTLLAKSLAVLSDNKRLKRPSRTLKSDRILQALVSDLVAARTRAAMTQAEVAARMSTTKSVISRLESGARTRPTLSVEKYAAAVGAQIEIRVVAKR